MLTTERNRNQVRPRTSHLSVAALLFSLWAFGGCAVVKSSKTPSGFIDDGISYSLPTGRIHLTVTHKKSGSTDVAVEEVVVPDPTQQYYAEFNLSVLSKDNVKITLENGLLTHVTSTSEDQTGFIAKNLAKTAKQVAQILAMGVGGVGDDPVDLTVDVVFDPFHQPDVDALNKDLGLIGGVVTPLTCPLGARVDGDRVASADGVLYRPPLPFAFDLKFKGSRINPISEVPDSRVFNSTPAGSRMFVVNLPSNCSPILSLDVDRTAFGKNVTAINFDKGMLKDWNVNKDSELAGFSQIPVDITAEIMTLPQDLLTLRYNNVSAQDKLVAEQTKLLDDQRKLINAQQDLNAAVAAVVNASSQGGATPTAAAAPPAQSQGLVDTSRGPVESH